MADRNLSGRSIEEGHQSSGGVKFIQRDALHSNLSLIHIYVAERESSGVIDQDIDFTAESLYPLEKFVCGFGSCQVDRDDLCLLYTSR